jgi:hypothetical protein
VPGSKAFARGEHEVARRRAGQDRGCLHLSPRRTNFHRFDNAFPRRSRSRTSAEATGPPNSHLPRYLRLAVEGFMAKGAAAAGALLCIHGRLA